MQRPTIFLSCFVLLIALVCHPMRAGAQRARKLLQIDRSAFAGIDSAAIALGPMPATRLQTIVDSLSSPCKDELCRLRAIYRWITKYVTLDGPGSRHPNRFNPSASVALQQRVTNSEGYARLFQEACKLARIRCTTVGGVAKSFPAAILKPGLAEEHYWNIVQLDDQRYFIDVAWSAGLFNEKFEEFDPRYFEDGWFMTNHNLFYLSHWPDDKALQKESGVITKLIFRQGPIVRSGAEVYDVFPLTTQKGRQRGKLGGCLRLEYEVRNPALVKKVYWGKKYNFAEEPAEMYVAGNKLYVDVPLEDAGRQQLWIRFNDRVAYGYVLEVNRAARR